MRRTTSFDAIPSSDIADVANTNLRKCFIDVITARGYILIEGRCRTLALSPLIDSLIFRCDVSQGSCSIGFLACLIFLHHLLILLCLIAIGEKAN